MSVTIKILAIDGEDIILKSIAKALKPDEEFEYAVTAANNAIEGLRLVRSIVFDVVLVDSVLAGMNTEEALRRIKRTSPAASVIVMTGYSSEQTAADTIHENADGLLSKPFTASEIRSTISIILRKRKGPGA